jgi:serine/threonine protein kinase
MEFFPFGTLNVWINGVTLREPEAKLIARQLVEGLKIMHEEGFTHRDLKPQVSAHLNDHHAQTMHQLIRQNIFVVHMAPVWWVKIGDFGISKRVSNDETALQTATGTPHYLAPEVRHYVRDKSMKPGVYTNAVDIWSFACVIYQILACQVPFPGGALDLIHFCEGGSFPEGPLVPSISGMGIDFLKFVMVRGDFTYL